MTGLPAESSAGAAEAESAPKSLRMSELLSRGTNGKSGYTPEILKACKDRSLPKSARGRIAGSASTMGRRSSVYLAGAGVRGRQPGRDQCRVAARALVKPWAVLGTGCGRGGCVRAAACRTQRRHRSVDLASPDSLRGRPFWPTRRDACLRAFRILAAFCSADPYMKLGDLHMLAFDHGGARRVCCDMDRAWPNPATSFVAVMLAATVSARWSRKRRDASFASCTLDARQRAQRTDVLRTLAPSRLRMRCLSICAIVARARHSPTTQISPLDAPRCSSLPRSPLSGCLRIYQEQRRFADDLGMTSTSASNEPTFRSPLRSSRRSTPGIGYTAGHSAAVAIYARDIVARLGLSDDEQQLAHVCGLVHDIGKIGLPPGLLEKPGALTLAERRVMETHSEIGERILAKVEDYAEIAHIVRHHHERWDGQGYPDGLAR